MSQIQSYLSGMGPGGPILTLTGDTGGAVGPDGGGNIFIEGAQIPEFGFSTVLGSPVANTLSILPLSDTETTNDGVVTFFAVARRTMPNNSSMVMSAHVIGNRDDLSAACGGFTTGCARRVGAAAPIFVGDNTMASEDAPGGTPLFGIGLDGNDLAVYVQGLAGQTWDWTCTFTYHFQEF